MPLKYPPETFISKLVKELCDGDKKIIHKHQDSLACPTLTLEDLGL